MHKGFFLFFLFFSFIRGELCSESAVTYQPASGRFGDNLLCYLHAKWVSYKWGVPVLYKPFVYSEELVLHEEEKRWSLEEEKRFDRVIHYKKGEGFDYLSQPSALCVVSYFPECAYEIAREHWEHFAVDWKDQGFRDALKKVIRPIRSLTPAVFPQDKEYIKVALHVRSEKGFDDSNAPNHWPLKFPPRSYYLECLQRMKNLFPGRPLYIHLFTDDPNPSDIIKYYRAHLPVSLDITFNWRKRGNSHDTNVMEDFFMMQEFDCLIRSASNYTFPLPLITDYKVVMEPAHFKKINKKLVIDKINVIINDS